MSVVLVCFNHSKNLLAVTSVGMIFNEIQELRAKLISNAEWTQYDLKTRYVMELDSLKKQFSLVCVLF